jgi:transcription termination factor Rho
MSVLTRSALEGSPLADLHAIASEIGIDGFRRLRKADLVDAIIDRQGGDGGGGDEGDDDAALASASTEGLEAGDVARLDNGEEDDEPAEDPPARRSRRGGRSRGRGRSDGGDDGGSSGDGGSPRSTTGDADADADEDRPARRSRRGGSRRGGGQGNGDAGPRGDADSPAEDRIAEGVVELLSNGSGFVRVSPPEPSDDDVYVSAAQVRRCELVSGDTVSGPVRAPRRSERYPSLVRVDTINGSPADEVAEGTHFDDLPATFPAERFALNSEDPTLKAIEWLTPIGRGSRVSIVGGPRAGKSEALRRLAGALAAQEGIELTVVLAGVRPEEISEWRSLGDGFPDLAAGISFAASADAQGQAVERAVETAKRVAARGAHAVVLVDTVDGLHPAVTRKALAAARNIAEGGTLTIVATASAPLGGETTVIALDAGLTSTGRFPALDLVASGTLRPELLVGDAGADAIAQARAGALG